MGGIYANLLFFFSERFDNLRYCFKAEAYKNEAEVRLSIHPKTHYRKENEKNEKISHRLSENGVFVEYLKLKIDIQNDIKSIMCHPGSTELHKQGAERFIDNKYEYKYICNECKDDPFTINCKCKQGRIKVEKSNIPWRKV